MESGNTPLAFFAYPSQPREISETVATSIANLNSTGYVRVQDWKQLSLSGKIVIRKICAAIDDSQILLAEVTHLNPNVLFELGFAVGRNKRIWLALDPSYSGATSLYRQVKALTTIGYAQYTNAADLVAKFLKDQPFSSLGDTVYSSVIAPLLDSTGRPSRLLYLKSPIETESSSRLTRVLSSFKIPVATDDPEEVPIQTLDWYCEQVVNSTGLLAHFLGDDRTASTPIHNAKYAFVSGLAHGLAVPILMLAHAPFDPPFDYQDLLYVHSSPSDCESVAEKWISDLADRERRERGVVARGREADQAALALRRVHIGDYIAENEQSELSEYFIETAAFFHALHANQSMIYVGRKGTGKTANLYQVAEELRRRRTNHVTIVKPVDYDLDGVLRLLHLSTPMAEQGYLMESLWKYLVYTQIALSYCERLESQPAHLAVTEGESSLVDFARDNPDFMNADFTVRLGSAVSRLCNIQFSEDTVSTRAKVSEILHVGLLGQLRTLLGAAFSEREKVCVLVDNLDKAWNIPADLPFLSQFVFGLTSVSRAITEEFQRSGPAWRRVSLTVLVFLRSDIFNYIMAHAREVDKLVYTSIDWSDPEMLRRLIEERLKFALQQDLPVDELWARLFTPAVRGIPTHEYLVSRVLPRPRDIIYICRAALARAVNRAHARVEEVDVLQAEKEYSQYAFLTLLSEIRPQYPALEELLVELAGAPHILPRAGLEAALSRARLPEGDVQTIIPLLAESLFLAPEVEVGDFRFLYDYANLEVLQSLARATTARTGYERYRIHPAFSAYLELQ